MTRIYDDSGIDYDSHDYSYDGIGRVVQIERPTTRQLAPATVRSGRELRFQRNTTEDQR